MSPPQQTVLELGDTKRLEDLRPSPHSAEPKIWVERLAVYKDWPPGEETLLREVELHRGLNILWAETKESASPDGRLAGHGAGKTTFCRLLRYALGDPKPGNQQFRASFRASFPAGWVLADVWINGTRWLVGRPLGERGHHPWAIKGGTLLDPLPETLPRGGFSEYESELNDTVFRDLPKRQLSGSGTQLEWPLLLQWLARDQEAHYAGLTDWRVKESDSDNPGLSMADRDNLMRLVLGLVDDVEQEKLRLRESKGQEHERKLREKPQRAYHLEQSRVRLSELWGEQIGFPGDLLFTSAVTQRVAAFRRDAQDALRGLQDDEELINLIGEEAKRLAEKEIIRQQKEEIEVYIARQRGTVQASSANAATARQTFATTSYLPFRGYCSTPLVIAKRRGCPCLTERPEDDEVKQKTEAIVQSAGTQKERLAELEKDLNELKVELAARTIAHEAAKNAAVARRKALNEQVELRSKPQLDASALESAFTSYILATEKLTEIEGALEKLAGEKEALDKELTALARQHRDAMRHFASLFDLIVKSMLVPRVEGRIEFSGKSLEPTLHFHGSYESAAPNLTKVLAFDIAAMALSQFSGIGHHPRFLLHDSPRESDLAPEIYAALFNTALRLEAACGSNAGFQYIITTTSAPPGNLQGPPWLLEPKLDSTQAASRFLGVDLG